MNELLSKLTGLIEALGFDYDRMSRSGQATYDEICDIVRLLNGGN